MFTCCPQCSTVFRVTANQLRAARGDVRCGNCAHVFNAMESLVDELPKIREVAANDSPADDSMEFDAPEQTWSEIFIEAPPGPGDIALDGELEAITADPDEWRSMLAELGVEPADMEPDSEVDDTGISVAATSLAAGGDEDHEDFSLDGDDQAMVQEPVYVIGSENHHLAGDETPAVDSVPEPPAEPAFEPAFEREGERTPEPVAHEEPALDPDYQHEAEPEPEPEPALDPDYEHVVMESAEPVFSGQFSDSPPDPGSDFPLWNEMAPAEETEPKRRGGAVWVAAIVLLAGALAGQLAHQARDGLAAHPRYGELVRNVYARLDQRLYPAWSLDSFYIRRSEALAGGSTPDALDISAALEVTGAQPVGLPLVRVTLRDQWANTIGRRVFLPEEYLAADMPDIVAPGTRIPVILSLADPGTEARGYEVDLCLQRRRSGLQCQLVDRP